MGKKSGEIKVTAPLNVFIIYLSLVLIPLIIFPAIGFPQFDFQTGIVFTALTGFVFGIVDRKFILDNFVAFINGLILYLFLMILLDIVWYWVLTVFLLSFLLARKIVEKRQLTDLSFV